MEFFKFKIGLFSAKFIYSIQTKTSEKFFFKEIHYGQIKKLHMHEFKNIKKNKKKLLVKYRIINYPF